MSLRITGAFLLGLSFLVAGCTWQRIESVPPSSSEAPLPIVVGLQSPTRAPLEEAAAAEIGGELQKIELFNDVLYPYRSGDPIDCMLVYGSLTTATGEGAAAAFISGLTFGLTGLAVGPSMTARADVKFHMSNGTQRIISGAIHVETKAEFGIYADIGEVTRKMIEVHLRKIANGIASNVNSNRDVVLDGCRGYSDSSTYSSTYEDLVTSAEAGAATTLSGAGSEQKQMSQVIALSPRLSTGRKQDAAIAVAVFPFARKPGTGAANDADYLLPEFAHQYIYNNRQLRMLASYFKDEDSKIGSPTDYWSTAKQPLNSRIYSDGARIDADAVLMYSYSGKYTSDNRFDVTVYLFDVKNRYTYQSSGNQDNYKRVTASLFKELIAQNVSTRGTPAAK